MKLNLKTANTVKDENDFKTFIDSLNSVGKKVTYKKDDVVFAEGGKANFLRCNT